MRACVRAALCSWRQKLELQKRVLVDSSPMARPSVESLSLVYAYATWVNTGAVPCSEDGGHHRPNHHASLALQVGRRLAQLRMTHPLVCDRPCRTQCTFMCDAMVGWGSRDVSHTAWHAMHDQQRLAC